MHKKAGEGAAGSGSFFDAARMHPKTRRSKKKSRKSLPLQRPATIHKAIDGARTRGLDLGKVARYQLRHYRIVLTVLYQRHD